MARVEVSVLKNSMKLLGLVLNFLFLVVGLNQAISQDQKLLLNWKDPIPLNNISPDSESGPSTFLLSVDRAIYPAKNAGLPVVSESLPLSGNLSSGSWGVELEEALFEPVPSDQLRFIDRKQIPDHIEVETFIQISRKKPFIRYEFVPLRRNAGTGQIERLVSCNPSARQTGSSNSVLKYSGNSRSYANQSVLAAGQWYKIRVKETGIHRIGYNDLISFGISDPAKARIFGNGGKQLTFDSSKDKKDDLIENPIYLATGNDGIFNSGDFLLFFAEGPVSWSYSLPDKMFVHNMHLYSDFAYYFITTDAGTGRKVTQLPEVTGTPDYQVSSFDDYLFREKDSVNLIKSGQIWCWTHFSIELKWGFSFSFPNRISDAPVKMLSNLLSRSTRTSENSKFHLIIDDNVINTVSLPGVNTSNYEALFVSSSRTESVFTPKGGEFRLDIQYAPSNPAAEGWLDYLVLNTRSRIRYNGKQLKFRDIESIGQGVISRFSIQTNGDNIQVWDVTDKQSVKSLKVSGSGNMLSFSANTDQLREFIAFNPLSADLPVPEFEGEDGMGIITNQNLHGEESPDMIIIVHNDLLEYAQDLADFHTEYDGIESLIVTPQQIYNEFSSGSQDATAIRDFLKMFYDRSGSDLKLKYLLLFGDGSYDNKNITKEFATCLPTFQSLESFYPTSSYVTDDYFGLLDDGEGLEPGLLDIGIGRFPVVSPHDAEVMVDKVKHYKDPVTYGDWRNLICFIGDDEDGNSHMEDANTLAEKVNQYYPSFNLDKIFLDAYQQISVPAGERYPEVNRAINDRIKKGALIMNYIGHGSERGLAHEEILTTSDIQAWNNYDKLPLFITATCEFSRFDDHEFPSAGEMVVLNPDGGGIGLFTTTRLVYSSPNFRLNKELYDYIFNQKPDGSRYRFGDIMLLTKNAVGTELNKLNFTLLSDPALSLNFPENNIVMTSINDQAVGEFTDTLKALSQATVRGYIADLQGNKMEGFNGIVIPSVFDKEVVLNNLANDGGPIMEFTVQKNILFRGKVSVNQGDFKFSFIVPKDIAYNIGTGRFSYYATDGSSDANGVNLSVLIGGSADSVYTDLEGPEVRLYMNDTSFVYGGLTNENPVFLARVSDQYGINTVGNGIGHDVTAILDDNRQSILVLNDYYESDLDNYKSGMIRYPLQDLEPGTHKMKLKVWDILNNSTETEIQFEVMGSARLELKNILNYPNPFTTHTEFYFEHNQANIPLDVQIQVFTVSGRLVKSFSFLNVDNTQIESDSFRVGPVAWDGLDDFGDRIGRGTYIYRIRVRTLDDRTQEGFQKLVILR